MSSILSKIEASAKTLGDGAEADVKKIWADVEPAIVEFLGGVSHGFVAAWLPRALASLETLLASGTAITTSTIASTAVELEKTALATGETVLTQDALTTVQAAAAKLSAAKPAQ